jgi:outer membrane protein assembly factor BamA
MKHRLSKYRGQLTGVVLQVLLVTILSADAPAVTGEPSEDSARALVSTDLAISHNTSVNVYPFAYYNPELKLAFGAGGIITFYTGEEVILRPSKITLSGYYSTSNQYKISLAPQVYLDQNRVFVSSSLYYGDKTYYMPDAGNPEVDASSYGISAELRVAQSPPAIDPIGLTDLTQLGVIIDYEHVSFQDDEPGFEDVPPHNLGFGLARIWDSRDNIFYPNSGKLLRVEALFNSKALGSSFDFNRYEVDLRWYQSINAGLDQLWAFQFFFEATTADPPPHQLPALGGSNLMRGYTSGSHRNRLYLAGQAEARTHLWWRLGAVGFAGMGDVADEFSDFQLRNLRPSYGGGLRFVFNEKESVNLRMDIGFGEDTDGVYFGVEEAF